MFLTFWLDSCPSLPIYLKAELLISYTDEAEAELPSRWHHVFNKITKEGQRMLLGDMIKGNARKHPDKTALALAGTRYTYSQFNNRINQLANALLDQGIKKGDGVAVLADTCLQYIEIFFATAKCGMVCVPVNNMLDNDGISYIINNSEAVALAFGEKYSATVNSISSGLDTVRNLIVIGEAPGTVGYEDLTSRYPADEPKVAVDEDDLAWLLYTSGTTGLPKGVMLSHKNLIANTVNTIMSNFPVSCNDIHLNLLPMFHSGMLCHMNCLFYIGGTNMFLERFDPELFYRTVDQERVTTSALVANMIVPLIEYPDIDKYDISGLRMVVSAGAPMSPELLKRANNIFGDIFMDVFALTEASPMLTGPPLFEGPWEKVKRPGSAGKEMLNIEVKVVNENGSEAAPGEIGEIVARGDNIMIGYWKMPEETARVLRDGYLHTGDLASKDRDGYFHITGRKKDMIISGGNTIYATEVEDTIYSHPSVSEVAVIGVPDKALGELVKAVVVLKKDEETTAEEIIKLCQEKLGSYKVPKSVVFTDSLPKTPTAKVLKNVLKEKYG